MKTIDQRLREQKAEGNKKAEISDPVETLATETKEEDKEEHGLDSGKVTGVGGEGRASNGATNVKGAATQEREEHERTRARHSEVGVRIASGVHPITGNTRRRRKRGKRRRN